MRLEGLQRPWMLVLERDREFTGGRQGVLGSLEGLILM